MSDNQVQLVPEDASTVLPSEILSLLVEGGQDVQVTPVEADLQSVDPVIERRVDVQAESSDSEISGDLRAVGPVINDLQVPASVLQSSVTVGLQLSASVSITLLRLPSSSYQVMIAYNITTCSSDGFAHFQTLPRFGRNTSRLFQMSCRASISSWPDLRCSTIQVQHTVIIWHA
jgi:hypothetical protein